MYTTYSHSNDPERFQMGKVQHAEKKLYCNKNDAITATGAPYVFDNNNNSVCLIRFLCGVHCFTAALKLGHL